MKQLPARLAATVACFFACVVSCPFPAFAADSADARAAQTLFDEARALMAAGRPAEACPKFAESQRLDPGGGTLLNLAACHATEGKLATALIDYEKALAVAKREKRRDRESFARTAIAKLEREVPKVTISPPPAGVELRLDGVSIPASDWGKPLRLDPGEHTLTASVSDGDAVSQSFTLTAGEVRTLSVPDPRDAAKKLTAPKEPHPAETLPPMVHVETAEPATPSTGSTRTNPAFVGSAVAVGVALPVSLVTGLVALTQRTLARTGCNLETGICRDASSRSDLASSTTWAWVSTGALVVAAVGGIGLFVLPRQVQVSAMPSPSGTSLSVSGTF